MEVAAAMTTVSARKATSGLTVASLSVKVAVSTEEGVWPQIDVHALTALLDPSAKEITGQAPVLLWSATRCARASSVGLSARKHSAVPQSGEPGATPARCVLPSPTPAAVASFPTFARALVKMWMNARPSLGSVKEEIALILLGLLSANALLDTNLMKCHKNVKILMNAALFLVSVMGVNAQTQSAATSANVPRVFTPLLMVPDV